MTEMTLAAQVVWLLMLAAPVACVAWTVTHEEVCAEFREWCTARSRRAANLVSRKFFYLFTCEYCFSHYVSAAAVWLTGFRMLLPDWRGAVLAWLASVWVANFYMSLFVRLRLDIKRERVEVEAEERDAARRNARPMRRV